MAASNLIPNLIIVHDPRIQLLCRSGSIGFRCDTAGITIGAIATCEIHGGEWLGYNWSSLYIPTLRRRT